MRTIIFANGDAPDPEAVKYWSAQADLIIAADGGTRNALNSPASVGAALAPAASPSRAVVYSTSSTCAGPPPCTRWASEDCMKSSSSPSRTSSGVPEVWPVRRSLTSW